MQAPRECPSLDHTGGFEIVVHLFDRHAVFVPLADLIIQLRSKGAKAVPPSKVIGFSGTARSSKLARRTKSR